MLVTQLLTPDRILVRPSPSDSLDKRGVLRLAAELLAKGTGVDRDVIYNSLLERESIQSTGIGEGVAIPHEKLDALDAQCAAFIIVPPGLPFDAIDGENVNLVFAVVGPRSARVEHLKVLARISKLLRSRPLRAQLLSAPSGAAAFDLLVAEEQRP